MTSKLKNIIKLNVGNLLNEVDKVPVSDLPQKKVVDSDTAHNSAVAQSTLGNIDQRFRELGVGVNAGAMHTPKLLAAMGSFNFGFKLGDTEYKGQAKVVNQSPLTLVFKGSVTLGEEKSVIKDPTITFLGDLKTKEAESGVDVTAISVGGTYKVSVDSGKTQLVFGGDEKLVVDDKKRIRTVFDLTAKSGKTYGGGEPEMIVSQEDSKGPNGEIEITHLPEIQGKEEAGGKNNAKLDLSNPINVSGRLQIDGEQFKTESKGTEDDFRNLNDGLKRATALLSGSRQPYHVVKITLPNSKVLQVKPIKNNPFPYYIKNWSNGLDVVVSSKAGGIDSLEEFKATVILKTR